MAEGARRQELRGIPADFHGEWRDGIDGGEDAWRLRIQAGELSRSRDGADDRCTVEEAVVYFGGAFPFSYLFGNERLAVVCDRSSTDAFQARWGSTAVPPDEYRTTFYLLPAPDPWPDRAIEVEFTMHLPPPFGEGEPGTFVQTLSIFLPQ